MSKTKPEHTKFSDDTLGQILSSFSSKELNHLAVFLKSEFSEAQPNDIKLFELVRHNLNIEKIQLHQKLFLQQDYNNAQLNRRTSKLRKHVEDFIIIQKIRADKTHSQKLLSEFYDESGFFSAFKNSMTKLNRNIENIPSKNQSYYLEKFQFNQWKYFHPDTQKFKPEVNPLYAVHENLDNFYVLAKIQLCCEYLVRSNIWNTELPPFLMEEITQYAENNSENDLFDIYSKLVRLFNSSEANPEKFEEIRILFEEKFETFQPLEQGIILQFLINYSNFLIQSGYSKFQTIQFNLYEIGIKNKTFLHFNRIDDLAYTNIVVSGCVAKEFDKVKHFMSKHLKYLDKNIKDDAECLSKAYYYFHLKQFDKANHEIQLAPTLTLYYKLRTKSLEIRCQFEFFLKDSTKDREDLVKNKANNFKVFIDNNRTFSDVKKNPYSNFIYVVKKLVKHYHKPASVKKTFKDEFNNRLQTSKLQNPNSLLPIVAKSWLLEKIENL